VKEIERERERERMCLDLDLSRHLGAHPEAASVEDRLRWVVKKSYKCMLHGLLSLHTVAGRS
jgi:hypothetical protein